LGVSVLEFAVAERILIDTEAATKEERTEKA